MLLKCWLLCLVMLVGSTGARGQAVAYTDEGAFLAALASMGSPVLQEGFEDEAVWGGVRTTISGGAFTAPSVSNQGVTWVSSSASVRHRAPISPCR